MAASLLGGLVGENLVLTFTFLNNHSSLPPVSSLWCHAVWVEWLTLHLPTSPALLVLLIYGVVAGGVPIRRALVQFSFSLLFVITSALSFALLKRNGPSMVGGAGVALVIAITVVLAERRKSQNNLVEDIAGNAAKPHQ